MIGKGHQIFQGTFISSGKINPGFNGRLNIGLYNGSKKRIHIKKGQPLCSCVFLQMESNMQSPLKDYDATRKIDNIFTTRKQRFIYFIKANKEWLAIIISFLSLLASITIGITNRNFIMYNKSEQTTPTKNPGDNGHNR